LAERDRMLAEVQRRLGGRRLVWAGLRGDDIEPLSDLPQLAGSYSILGAYTKRSSVQTVAYENLTGLRVDPETWDIDEHLADDATAKFRQGLLRALGSNSALLPYRPSQFLSAVHFARQRECLYLGQFSAQQAAFEHKPWVETAVATLGLPRVPWTYVADEEQLKARELSRHGSVVLRRSRTSGGHGFAHVDSPEQLAAAWPAADEAFVSVAPYLDGATPVNIGATVWRDGITVHHPSVQLIGIRSCVSREFGYCGNDFGLARDLDGAVIDQIESSTVLIGNWLRAHGYLGSYGVDFLVHDGVPLFTEVNPRFQGSTTSSCRLSIEAGAACLLLENLAAWLGMPCPASGSLRSLVAKTPDFANIVVHWTGDTTQAVDAHGLVDRVRDAERSTRSDVLVPQGVKSEPGSTVARMSMRRRVTPNGFDISGDIDSVISAWQRDMQRGDLFEESA
jgi:hypothetical protein